MLFSFLRLIGRLIFFTGAVEQGSYPRPLTKAEETECFQRMKSGDASAKDKLIRHNMRLVAHIVKKYSGSAENDDLISVGSIGLIKAISSYDPAKGTTLSTYAARCVENEILMLLRAGKKHRGTVSLSDPVGVDKDGNELTLMELLPEREENVFEDVERALLREKLVALLKANLDRREYEVIGLRYGLEGAPLPQREVAKKLGISRSYVSRIEKKAIGKLKDCLSERDF